MPFACMILAAIKQYRKRGALALNEMYFAIALVNIVVGAFIGMTGVAGFLLPIFYMNVCQFTNVQSLFLSFITFIISGCMGSWYYYKTEQIDLAVVKKLGIGNIAGAIIGALSLSYLSAQYAKTLLYVIVLLSGIWMLTSRNNKQSSDKQTSRLVGNSVFLCSAGAVIAFISTISGAGGPVLSIPCFSALGMNPKKAVGIGLCSSIFISFTATVIYFFKVDIFGIIGILLLASVSHGIGLLIGTRIAGKLNTVFLKKIIIFGSIGISLFMLHGLS